MRNLLYFFKLLFLSSSLLLISCNEEDEPQTTSSLLATSWDVVKFQRKLPSETVWTDSNSDCVLDDTWEFTSSNEVIIYSGSFLCDGTSNASNITYDYELAANDTKIIFVINGYEYEEDIEELTEDTLITTYALGTTDNAQGRRIFTKTE